MYVHSFVFFLGGTPQTTLTVIMLKVIHDWGKKPKNVNKKENFLVGEGRIFF